MQPINYGGMLGSSMASGVDTGIGLGQAYQRANLINEEKQAMQLAQEQQKANAAKMVELYRSGTPDQVAEFSLANPESGRLLMGAISDRTGINQGEIMKVSESILTNPKGAESALTERIQMIQGRGGDPSDTVRMLQEYRENPSQFMQQNEMFYAMNNPDKYKQYKSLTTSEEGAPQYTNIEYDQQGNPFGLNKKTGQFEQIQGGFVRGEKKPQTVVNVGKAEGEQAKTIAKAEGENYNAIIKDANTSRQSEQQLSRLEKLNEKAFEGSAAGLMKFGSKLLSPFGVDVEGLTETELFESIGNNLVLGQTSKLSGVLTDKDMEVLASTVPQLSQTREGRKELIKVMRELNSASQDKARLANKYRKENNGQFDSQGFEEWLATQPKKDRFEEIKAETKTEVETPAGLGSTPITEMSDDELMKSLGL